MHTRIVLVLTTFLLALATVFAVRLTYAAYERRAHPRVSLERLPGKLRPKPVKPPPPPPPAAPRASPEDAAVYRLDFVLVGEGAGHALSMSSYTLNLAEHDKGEIRTVSNVPLGTGTRIDVGLKLACDFVRVGDEIMLRESEEMSRVEQGGGIRKLEARGDALVAPGKPTVVTSIDDPSNQLRYVVTVTATRLR